MPNIKSELSAQGYKAQPNPMAARCNDYAIEKLGKSSRAADQGCGRLRNLNELTSGHSSLLLVDTKRQLEHLQLFNDKRQKIIEFCGSWNRKGNDCRLQVMSAGDFAGSQLELDVIYTIATYDVVLKKTRKQMAGAAFQNLKKGGLYFIVAPRNDSSILQRCNSKNSYQDGYVFKRNGMHTFFKNFKDTSGLIDMVKSAGFKIEEDLSIYRQATIAFKKI